MSGSASSLARHVSEAHAFVLAAIKESQEGCTDADLETLQIYSRDRGFRASRYQTAMVVVSKAGGQSGAAV